MEIYIFNLLFQKYILDVILLLMNIIHVFHIKILQLTVFRPATFIYYQEHTKIRTSQVERYGPYTAVYSENTTSHTVPYSYIIKIDSPILSDPIRNRWQFRRNSVEFIGSFSCSTTRISSDDWIPSDPIGPGIGFTDLGYCAQYYGQTLPIYVLFRTVNGIAVSIDLGFFIWTTI